MNSVAVQQSVEAAIVQLKKTSTTEQNIKDCVRAAVEKYLRDMDGHQGCELYDLLMKEVEHPLLEGVLKFTRGNQTQASEILGLNRGTLRKKLRLHGLV
ncbi:MAG: DNA-binding transcriptional regulator Fis [Gammaproteobacteria bacterium]|nr:DNA-binding transcriptional regulator Fis [Gammaproteobacteria bacterium]